MVMGEKFEIFEQAATIAPKLRQESLFKKLDFYVCTMSDKQNC